MSPKNAWFDFLNVGGPSEKLAWKRRYGERISDLISTAQRNTLAGLEISIKIKSNPNKSRHWPQQRRKQVKKSMETGDVSRESRDITHSIGNTIEKWWLRERARVSSIDGCRLTQAIVSRHFIIQFHSSLSAVRPTQFVPRRRAYYSVRF